MKVKNINTYMQYLYESKGIVNDCIIKLNENLKRITLPDNTVGFRFFQKEITTENNKTTENVINVTPWAYVGRIMTEKDLVYYFGPQGNRMLNRVIEDSQGNPTCLTRNGNFLTLVENDTIYAEVLTKENRVLTLNKKF